MYALNYVDRTMNFSVNYFDRFIIFFCSQPIVEGKLSAFASIHMALLRVAPEVGGGI